MLRFDSIRRTLCKTGTDTSDDDGGGGDDDVDNDDYK